MTKLLISASAKRRKKSVDLKYRHVKLLRDFWNLGFHSFDAFYTSFILTFPKYKTDDLKYRLGQFYVFRITSEEINDDLETVIETLKNS